MKIGVELEFFICHKSDETFYMPDIISRYLKYNSGFISMQKDSNGICIKAKNELGVTISFEFTYSIIEFSIDPQYDILSLHSIINTAIYDFSLFIDHYELMLISHGIAPFNIQIIILHILQSLNILNMYEILKNGHFVKQDIAYKSLMKRHIKKHTSYLQPIFEAISNALEATSGSKDTITIRLKFSKMLMKDILEFNSIEISDTGIGFNEENLKRLRSIYDESKSFNNLGTGRIQYLHFFDKTDIYSTYQENGVLKKRRIVLSANFWDKENAVIWEGDPIVTSDEQTGTNISFYFPLYEEDKIRYTELSTSELYDKIFLRYLSRFCLNKKNLQKIKIQRYINDIHDEVNDKEITGDKIPSSDYEDSFTLKYQSYDKDKKTFVDHKRTETFNIRSYLLDPKIQKKNDVKLTSKNETVDICGMDFSFMDNSSKIDKRYMLCLISSDFITNQDSDLRGKLRILSKNEFLKKNDIFEMEKEHIFIDNIQNEVVNKIVAKYPQIKKVKEDLDKNINELIELFALDRSIVEKIGYTLGEDTATFLRRYKDYNAELSSKKEAKIKSVIDSLKHLNPSDGNFREHFKTKVNEVSKLIPQKNRADIVNYISARKSAISILNFILKKQMEIQNLQVVGKRKNNERLIHDLLFKQHTDNTLDSNLWILNEDFIHYKGISECELRNAKINGELFLREDLTEEEVNKLKAYNRDQLGKRTDVLLFPEEHKCIIVELKSTDADVGKYLNQVIDYAGLIRQYAKDKFEITNFYAYLIGESFDFDAIINANPNFIEPPYSDYVYIPDQKINGGKKREKGTMYFEVLKYSTLLQKAALRNSVFFNKLF